MTSGGNSINDFPENQLPKFHPLTSRLRELIVEFNMQRLLLMIHNLCNITR